MRNFADFAAANGNSPPHRRRAEEPFGVALVVGGQKECIKHYKRAFAERNVFEGSAYENTAAKP